MVVKSETSGCKWCAILKKFWRDLKNDEPYAITISLSSIVLITVVGFGSTNLFDYTVKTAKYDTIITEKPLIKCGEAEEVRPSNYKVVLIDSEPSIKVFYSNTNIQSYSLSECSIIQEVMNPTLGKDNVEFVNSELKAYNTKLKTKIQSLKATINTRDEQIVELKNVNVSIKKDYKLPTQKQLDKYYTEFKKTKSKDIKKYISMLQEKEKKALAKARMEKPNKVEHIPCDKDDQDCLDLEYDVWQ